MLYRKKYRYRNIKKRYRIFSQYRAALVAIIVVKSRALW